MSATLDHDVADLQRTIAELQCRLDEATAKRDEAFAERDEALARETATAEVLQVISQSTFDLEQVLQTILDTAVRLCRAGPSEIFRLENDGYRFAVGNGMEPRYKEFERTVVLQPEPGTLIGRTALERCTVHVHDAWTDRLYSQKEQARVGNFHTMLGVPLIREAEVIGVIALSRRQVEPFTEREIQLVTTFADQAMIAIETARLLNETRQRQVELRVTFDSMADGIAMFDHEFRLTAWNRNFQNIIELPDEVLESRPTYADYLHTLAQRGEFGTEHIEAELSRRLDAIDRELRLERTRSDGRVLEVRRNAVPDGGFVLIYSDITERNRSEAEIRAARDAAERALTELKSTQASLLHAQKMASLGQLTAGIAHEIKNPLNFVNNFAGLSIELLDELKESAASGIATLDDDTRAEIGETVEMLTSNLEKIAEHGRRADGIVKSMLQHSRSASGERRAVDLNSLIDEALNLAYHGGRAQDQSFNVTLERDYDSTISPIELVPQDITRVCLNLFGNGFYAVTKRQKEGDDLTFEPVLKVSTRDVGDTVEIRIRDNGIGIPEEIKDKLFQPFFTTKPTGEGTGLGLSISYDIVTQEHGGTITVDSRVGEFTEFTIRLPRMQMSSAEATS